MQENRRQQRSRAGVLFGFLAIAIVVASVIGTLAAAGRFASGAAAGLQPGVLHGRLRIDTVRTAHLYCPSSPSISPDGSLIAVLGTRTPCTDPQASEPSIGEHNLAVYSVATGRLKEILPLDRYFIPNMLEIAQCGGVPVRTIQFTGLGWSPDWQNFAILYAGFEYPSFDSPDAISPDTEVCSGLLLLPMGPDSVCAFVCPIAGDSGFFGAAAGTYTGYSTWNTKQQTSYPPQMVAPALVYGWSANGQPQSESPLTGQTVTSLPTRAGPTYQVGNPSTMSPYSVWQPGLVAGPEVFGGNSASADDDDVFVTQFATWIPSGQYVTMVVAGVELAPPESQYETAIEPTPGTPTAVPLVPLPSQLTQVPARDSALYAVQQQIGADGWAMTAWNDPGTMLASINCTQVGAPRLELRDTATGAEVGSSSLGLPAGDPGCSTYNFGQGLDDYPNPNLSLQWSPVGSHVLLTDQTAGQLTLWQVASA